jgi:hypothetical protein
MNRSRLGLLHGKGEISLTAAVVAPRLFSGLLGTSLLVVAAAGG